MTLSQENQVQWLLKIGRQRLRSVTSSPGLEADLLLGMAGEFERTFLMAHPEHRCVPEVVAKFNEYLTRRLSGEPIAYIRGTQEFFGREFVVNKSVLIPRPETELLVEAALREIRQRDCVCRTVDAGTGSGCIPITLCRELKNCPLSIVALDRSTEALQVAALNAALLGAQESICFLQSNWLSCFRECSFDLIVSNPPYVSPDEPFDRSILLEPNEALFAEDDGLRDIFILIEQALRVLSAGGLFLCEIGATQQAALAEKLNQQSSIEWSVERDLAGKDRLLSIRLNSR